VRVKSNLAKRKSNEPAGVVSPATFSLEGPGHTETPAIVVKERVVDASPVGKTFADHRRIEVPEHKSHPTFQEVPTAITWMDSDGVETELGGVMFLLNLFIRMNLFQCFEADFKLSKHISGWGLLEVFARVWLSGSKGQYEDDNLWLVLRQLDGRESGSAIGLGFQGCDAYRIPAKWLEQFAPAENSWQVLDCPGRLVLWDAAAGFIIVDCPLNGAARGEVLAREIEFYHQHGVTAELQAGLFRPPDEAINWLPAAIGRDAHLQSVPQPLMKWLSWTFPFVRFVLRHALPARSQNDVSMAEFLFLKRGIVYSMATHFDLVMDMNEISLEVRRTCLDANPGWVRELMRVILFHFL
jgi:hypothetical protein